MKIELPNARPNVGIESYGAEKLLERLKSVIPYANDADANDWD